MAKAGVAYIDVEGNFNPFNQGLNGLLEGLSQRFAAFGGVGTKALAGVSLSAVAVGYGLTQVGKTFDTAYDTIRVGTGATGASLAALKEDFKAVAKEVPAGFQQVSSVIADVNTRLGLTGEPLRDVSTRILELTRLTGGDLSTNVAGITRLFGDWSIAGDDQAVTLDKLFRASQSTGIGIDQLADKVVFFGAPLRQLGFSFDEAIAMVSRFEKEGVNMETVLGGMRMGLARLAKAGEEPSATFKRVVAEIKELGDSGNIIESNARAMELFGARAGPDVAAAIREGRLELGSYIDTIANGKDTILGAAADTADFTEKWQIFKNRVLIAIEPIATRFFDAFNSALDDVLPLVDGLVAAFEPLAPVLAPLVLGFVGVAAAALPLAGVVKAVTAIGGAIKTVGVAIRAVSALMMANPWILALIAAAVVAVLIIKNWDKVKAFFVKLWATLKKAAAAAWEWIKDKTAAVWEKIKDYFRRFWPILVGIMTGGLGLIIALVIKHWDAIKAKTVEVWEAIRDFVVSIPGRIMAGIAWLLGAIAGFFASVWNGALNTTRNLLEALVGFVASIPGRIWAGLASLAGIVWDAIVGAFGRALDGAGYIGGLIVGWAAGLPGAIANGLGSLWDVGRNWLAGLWEGLKSLAGDVLGWIKGFASDAVDFIKHPWKILSPSKVTRELGVNFMAGLLGGMEQGGTEVAGYLGRFAGDAVDAVSATPAALGGTGGAFAFAAATPTGAGRAINLNLNGPITIRSDEDLVRLSRDLQARVDRADRAAGRPALRP